MRGAFDLILHHHVFGRAMHDPVGVADEQGHGEERESTGHSAAQHARPRLRRLAQKHDEPRHHRQERRAQSALVHRNRRPCGDSGPDQLA
ncbi:MAG: hypothetical protein R3E96_06010 [Planctomycetota bacterium]